MIHSDRIQLLMDRKGLSQSELARRVGVTQGAIAKISRKYPNGTSHLHTIARILGTTPAYLVGETNDPEEGAPSGPDLDSETLELVDRFATLAPADRRALLQVARSMADGPSAHGTVQAPPSVFEPE